MPGSRRAEGRRTRPAKVLANEGTLRRARAALSPPSGTEARFVEVAGEELLVIRVPLKRAALDGDLSAAEREVAALALSGLTNSEIGRRRGTSERTVANQMATIFRKLGVRSRAELARTVLVKGRS